MTLDLKKVHRLTGLLIEDTSVFNDDGKLMFDGEDRDQAEIWLAGYVQGNIQGIRETIDKFEVEVVPD